jgi:chromosome segregation ATPase
MAGSSYSSSKDSSRRRRDGSKRESISRTKRDSKDIDKKKPSSRTKRASVDSTSKVELKLLGGSDVALDAALMTPSVSSSEAAGTGGADQQRQEILRLHQMLSDALQKVATQSAEQIYDKDMLLKVNGELARLRADFELAKREKKELKAQLDERDRNIGKFVGQIDSLTESLERQRGEQALVEADLEQSEADVDKLLIKIEDLERAVDDSGNVTDETLRAELKEAKIAMVDKKREAERRKNRIEELEKEAEEQSSRIKELGRELEEIVTVNKLQISELEDEISGLQGKLKGERLESSSKITAQDGRITALEHELARYRGNSEYEEIAVVRKELEEAQHALEAATQELEAAKKTLTKFKAEKDDLVERNTKLNLEVKSWEKRVKDFNAKSAELEQRVLKWTEQTYEWKSKAEAAERKLNALSDGNSEIISDSGSTAEEAAPQGLFLQAAMDKRESSKKSNNMWSLFSRTGLGEEDQTAEEIRIRGLEEQNQGLQEKNSELQSELVKIQSAHKEEIYNKQKLLAHLKDENEALKVKTQTLEKLCGGDMELSS